jgi:hypothetical protein
LFKRDSEGHALRDGSGKFIRDDVGDWDLEAELLESHGLRPWEVARLDPDFVLTLITRTNAKNSPTFQKWLERQSKRTSKDDKD